MKCFITVTVWAFTLASVSATAQAPDVGTAAPQRWRDGYINWRGKRITARWETFQADDGTKFAIDLSSLTATHHVVAYIIEQDAFDQKNLFEFQFDCAGNSEVVSNSELGRARIVEKKAEELACGNAAYRR
jgi:hypothetical protein